jgi:hypothetical protein
LESLSIDGRIIIILIVKKKCLGGWAETGSGLRYVSVSCEHDTEPVGSIQ